MDNNVNNQEIITQYLKSTKPVLKAYGISLITIGCMLVVLLYYFGNTSTAILKGLCGVTLVFLIFMACWKANIKNNLLVCPVCKKNFYDGTLSKKMKIPNQCPHCHTDITE